MPPLPDDSYVFLNGVDLSAHVRDVTLVAYRLDGRLWWRELVTLAVLTSAPKPTAAPRTYDLDDDPCFARFCQVLRRW